MNGYPQMAGQPGFDRWGRATPTNPPVRYAAGTTKVGTKLHAVLVERWMRAGCLAWSVCRLPVQVLGPDQDNLWLWEGRRHRDPCHECVAFVTPVEAPD